MSRNRGQATILVLLFLAVGSLIIVPVLRYVTTGLYSQRIYEDAIAKEYTTDSAIEDILWQLLNGLISVNPQYPVSEYTFERGNASIEIPSLPASQDYKAPSVQHFMVQVTKVPRTNPPYDPSVAVGKGAAFDPENWVSGTGAVTIEYIIRIQTVQWQNLTNFSFTLPQGLTYTAGSSRALLVKQANLAWDTKVRMTDHKVLMKDNVTWAAMTSVTYTEVTQLPSPPAPGVSYLVISNGGRTLDWRPKITTETGNCVFIQTVEVTGNPPPWGILYVTSVNCNQLGYTIDKTAAIGVAMYTIVVTVEGVDYEVVVAYDNNGTPDTSDDTMKIISYHIVE